ncbi:hypothetical protein [Lentzea roselyniae]|uniref:hypothetical protein n=1 Tax=Lentzea roselyniae TaxID=531940 RepID=UPI0031F74298
MTFAKPIQRQLMSQMIEVDSALSPPTADGEPSALEIEIIEAEMTDLKAAKPMDGDQHDSQAGQCTLRSVDQAA